MSAHPVPYTFLNGEIVGANSLEILYEPEANGVITAVSGISTGPHAPMITSIKLRGLQFFAFQSVGGPSMFSAGFWLPWNSGDVIRVDCDTTDGTAYIDVFVTGFLYPAGHGFPPGAVAAGAASPTF